MKEGNRIKRERPSRRPPADRQLQQPVGQCCRCRGELYGGDVIWRVEGRLICEDCLEGFARRYFAPFRTLGEDLIKEEAQRNRDDIGTAVF